MTKDKSERLITVFIALMFFGFIFLLFFDERAREKSQDGSYSFQKVVESCDDVYTKQKYIRIEQTHSDYFITQKVNAELQKSRMNRIEKCIEIGTEFLKKVHTNEKNLDNK